MNEDFVKATEAETSVFKCPNCGANLEFSPSLQKLHCEFCGTSVDIQQGEVKPVDFLTGGEEGADWGNETVVYRCNNCGAREILSRTDIATTCPFCGTTNVVPAEELPGLRPTAVVPFGVDEEGARTNFKSWVRKKRLVPKKFKKQVEADKLHGVYNPCFVYNSDTVSGYEGRLGEHYTVTVGSGKNRRTETRIRWFHVSGSYQLKFEDFMVEASPHLDQKTVNKLKPFEYGKAALYDEKYLTGFTASSYDKDVNACWSEAKTMMEEIIRRKIKEKHHADVVDYLNVSTGYYQVTYRYLLLPVWFCNYTYKKKNYRFCINGTTSKVVGKVPRSAGKIALIVLGVLAAIGLFVWLSGVILPPGV